MAKSGKSSFLDQLRRRRSRRGAAEVSFQKCISIVKKQAEKVIADDYKLLTYLIFDAPEHGGKYEDRVKWLQNNIPQDDDKCFATVVGIKKCEGAAQLKQFLADVTKAGGEGIMLRKPGSSLRTQTLDDVVESENVLRRRSG